MISKLLLLFFACFAVGAHAAMSCSQLAVAVDLVRMLHVTHPTAEQIAAILNENLLDSLDPAKAIFLADEETQLKKEIVAPVTGDFFEKRDCLRLSALYKKFRLGIERSLLKIPPREIGKTDALRDSVLSTVESLAKKNETEMESWKARTFHRAHDLAELQSLAVNSLALETLILERGTLKNVSYAPRWEAFDIARDNFDKLRLSPIGLGELPPLLLQVALNNLDSHSAYLSSEDLKHHENSFIARFGLGAELSPAFGGLYVQRLLPGSPAEKSGLLMARDKLVAVNGRPLTNINLGNVVDLIRGPQGTKVILDVVRQNKKLSLSIARGQVPLALQNISSEVFKKSTGAVGYVKLREFSDGAAGDVAKVFSSLEKQKVRVAILDLRDNPGGYLDEAVQVVQLFEGSEPGNALYYRGSESKSVIRYPLLASDVKFKIPLIILVNQKSASAAEIVAGSLQAYGRAVIVGSSRTFGKGSVQTTVPFSHFEALNRSDLPDGGLRITTGFYFLPNGKSIQDSGLTPDILIFPSTPRSVKHILRQPAPLTALDVPSADKLELFNVYRSKLKPVVEQLARYLMRQQRATNGGHDPDREKMTAIDLAENLVR